MRILAALLIALLSIGGAQAQVQKTGTITPGHAAKWYGNNVIGDAGPATGSTTLNGNYLTELGITNTGTPLCVTDALTNAPGGYHQLCFAALTTLGGKTGAFITYNNYGAAAADNLYYDINGTVYAFPFTVGGIVGPVSSTIGNVACWNNITGSLLYDCGAFPTSSNQSANTVLAGPTSGAATIPTFRALVGADLPNPGASSKGGIQSATTVTHQWIDSINTSGVPHQSQPALSDISGMITVTPQGRLTLSTGVPVMTATVSGATTIYYTPYVGNTVPVWNGSNWTLLSCAELSNVTTNSASGNAGPAAVTTSSNYDLFVWSNSGTCTLTRGPAWTTNTARANTLVYQNGILVNNASITNGPTANQGTYVGTVHSNGSSTIDYIFGASASGGTAGSYQVWNNFNRVSTPCRVTDSGTTYTYATATIRQARASVANQCSFVLGVQEDAVQAAYSATAQDIGAISAQATMGVGLDTTSAFSCPYLATTNGTTNAINIGGSSNCMLSVGIGNHTIAAVEEGDGTNANVFDLSSNNLLQVTIRN